VAHCVDIRLSAFPPAVGGQADVSAGNAAAEAASRRQARQMSDLSARADRSAPAQGARSVFWPGDFIRRAAMAMRESQSTDYFLMARIGLEHAIRTEADVALLVSRPKASEAAGFATPQSFPQVNLPVATR
jgi:hypothetical protein